MVEEVEPSESQDDEFSIIEEATNPTSVDNQNDIAYHYLVQKIEDKK